MAEDWIKENFQWLHGDGVDKGQKFLQGMQVGANIANQRRSMDLQARKFALDQDMAEKEYELKKGTLDLRNRLAELEQNAKLQKAEGFAAVGGVLEKWAGKYDDPQAEAEFWSTARKFPATMDDPSYNNMADIFRRTREYKAREDALNNRVTAAQELENIKQANRLELERTRSELRTLHDSTRSATEERLDLLKSDEIAYRNDLSSLETAFNQGMIPTLEDYDKRKEKIVAKYKALARKPSGTNAPTAATTPAQPAPAAKTLFFDPKKGKFFEVPPAEDVPPQ